MASQDDFVRTALRVPPELHKKLHEAAAASNRTFNAEIVERLEKSFTDESLIGDQLTIMSRELFLLNRNLQQQGRLVQKRETDLSADESTRRVDLDRNES